MRTPTTFIVLSMAALFTGACGGDQTAAPAGDGTAPAAAKPTPISELPQIGVDRVLADTRALSSDEYEGRGPGTKGEELTVAYLIDQFTKAGLAPGNPNGTYIQDVPLVGITPTPAPLVFSKGAQKRELAWRDDVVAWTKHVADSAALERSELVFVGYGTVAPEYQWDDYKGIDVKGKTLVMLVNDPPIPDPASPSQLDARVFGGKAMTYYGRWTYKYEIGAEKGAAGVILIHETGPAGYPFDVVQSKVTEQFDLVTPDKNMSRVNIESWISLEEGRALMQMAGQEFDALKRRAATREFKPVPLGVTASMTIRNTLRTIDSKNVVAKLEGRDPVLKDEYVVYTAHWDHLGIGPAVNGDRIYNGAKDNAVGVAGLLEIARAFKGLPAAPRRSILFLAVTAEEQGLLGSQYYAVTPLYPLAHTAANINMDAPNTYGRTKDLTLIGYGASELDDYARDAAAEQGRTIRPDPEPENGYYYRSDHFNFAKQGVPAMYADEGVEFLGKPDSYGEKVRSDYTERDYHQPSDIVKADWDLSGAREDFQLFFAVGLRVADAGALPQWRPGNEFKAKRDEQLRAR